jgi:hypothetical protein
MKKNPLDHILDDVELPLDENIRKETKALKFQLNAAEKGNIVELFPEIAKEWNYEKNRHIAPYQFGVNSNQAVWWKCKNGHEWKAGIASRCGYPLDGIPTRKQTGCEKCLGKIATPENNLTITRPELVKEWDYEKNYPLVPEDFVTFSGKKVWWKCKDYSDHSWEAEIANRSGRGDGCNICAGKQVHVSNSLQTLFPEIAKLWHPTKNGNLTPSDVVCKSHHKAWWQCDKGHEWQAAISNITRPRQEKLKCVKCIKERTEEKIAKRKEDIIAKRPLNEEQVLKIRELYPTGDYSLRGLGKMFNVSHQIIKNVVNRKTYTDIL